MSTQTEALKLVEIIEHFDSNDESLPLELLKEISATLRALAQEQEPIAMLFGSLPVYDYTSPQAQRTWVGLTRMDLIKCGVLPFGMSYELCQAIEAKLKQKNGYAEEKNT